MPSAKLLNDIELYPAQIAEMGNAARLEDFFGRLGYDRSNAGDLNEWVKLNLTDNAQAQVRETRLIATGNDEGDIQIVLLVMRSRAMSHTQAIAQCLRQKLTSYLLILTVDFEIFDFALLERVKSDSADGRYIIRPRVLTIHSKNPGPVEMRVLKRFTYTETDDLAQWDKLRSAYTLAEWSEPNFNNRALFSDYYLKNRLTDTDFHPIWKEDVRDVGVQVKGLIAGARDKFTKQPEVETQKHLIEPLLKAIGFAFKYDAKAYQYTLFASESAKAAADKPLAILVAYTWNRNLDMSDPERDLDHPADIPGALIVTLLEQAAAPWVILTNGKLWRLYSTTAANKITNYYEVDLEEAIYAPDQATAFKYWWLIFRRAAFSDGLLDRILSESQAYARQIGKNLKDRIFEEIFGYFAGGFIDYMTNVSGVSLDNIRESQLDLIYHATMTYLYRLMFILYAESRELLPITQESGYAPHSLKILKGQIADRAGIVQSAVRTRLDKKYTDSDSTALYTHIQTLSQAINTGSQELNLPIYNGGLFSSESPEGKFLARYAIPDIYLAIGLDRLARDVDEKSGGLVFIDYKSLGVRELGSIYEGLLEFKLRIAAEDLAVIRDGKREIYLPRAQAEKEHKAILSSVKKDRVYIENTKQERKATGSYYTPDYIVNYIVEHTIDPILKEKTDALRERLHKAQGRYREHKKQTEAKNQRHPESAQSPELFWTTDKDAIALADDCLNIRVLDPAMGSGHFLVAAVDFISNRLIDFLNGWTENPVWALLERTRTDILTDLQSRGISVDESKLTRVVLLKRSVLKRCVYGVDLNAMAVELAKVSLWLDAFTLGAPLSFLDHHLKHGNSLIGARIAEVQDYLSTKKGDMTDMFSGNEFAGVMLATDLMRQVSYQSDNTIDQTRRSKQAFRQASDHLAPYKRLLDVYTARWFGAADVAATTSGKGKKSKTDNVKLFLKQTDVNAWLKDPTRPLDSTLIPAAQIGKVALAVAQDKAFFHWELEFPEVFFAPATPGGQDIALDPDGGFDAVVGNPPYKQIEPLPSFPDLPSDTFVYFWALLFKYAKVGGFGSFIVPSAWFTGSNYFPLRDLALKQGQVKRAIILPYDVFPDAYIDTCIAIILATRHLFWRKKGSIKNEFKTHVKRVAAGHGTVNQFQAKSEQA